jgi:hypothetical protein
LIVTYNIEVGKENNLARLLVVRSTGATSKTIGSLIAVPVESCVVPLNI